MKVGFTGSRDGMSAPQRHEVEQWVLDHQEWASLHHGACVGCDEDVWQIFYDDRGMFGPKPIHAHPSNLEKLTSKVALTLSDVVHPTKPPLDRNRDIVNASDVLLACPKDVEELRSGTWATVRWARKRKRRVVFFWPDGTVTEEQPRAG